MQMDKQTAVLIAGGVGSNGTGALFSTALDSDRSPAYCRGQGSFYGTKPVDPYKFPERFETHFNFSGAYSKLCCYCALVHGYNMRSFIDVGCYHCKWSIALIREFSKLKRRTEGVVSWSSCGWGGLSDSIIDLILKMVIEWKTVLHVKN
jgi:hypothetical protein